jgi:hypothetical protein
MATSWTAGVRFFARKRDVSLLHSVQSGSGVHPVSSPVVPGEFSLEVKWPEACGCHPLQTSAEVKNGGVVPPPSLRVHGVVLD